MKMTRSSEFVDVLVCNQMRDQIVVRSKVKVTIGANEDLSDE